MFVTERILKLYYRQHVIRLVIMATDAFLHVYCAINCFIVKELLQRLESLLLGLM